LSNTLKHYGVPGMKWGVRKAKTASGESDRVLVRKKGETLHHISSNPNLSPGVRELYTSFTKKDVLTYRAHYADQVRVIKNVDDIYDYELRATKDLIAPTQKKKIDTLLEITSNEPALLSEIANTKLKTGLIMQMAKALGFKNQDTEAQKYRKQLLSEDPKVQEKMLKDYVKYMILSDNARNKYIQRLEKDGFNSMYDDNDILSGYSDKPLIVFNAKSNVKVNSKVRDDQDATDRVFSELEALIKETK